jgi:outer membrane protein TolC
MRKVQFGLLFMAAALVAGGCSPSKRQVPLTSEAIDAGLTSPAMEVLRVQARSIRHPMLAPLEIKEGDGVSPDEAAVLAVLANPSLRAVRDARGLAAAQVLRAGLLPNPSLSFGREFPYAGPDTIVAYGIGLNWDITSLIDHAAKVDAAKAMAASVDLDVAWQEWQVAQTAKSAAWKVLSLQSQLEMANQADSLLQDNLKTVQKAVELQHKTSVDLSGAQAAQQEAHTTVLELERDLRKQRLALNRMLGLPAQTQVKMREEDFPDRPDAPDATDLQKGMEDRRLDLLALRRGYDSQEAAVRAAVLSRFPKIAVGASHARDTGGVYTFGYDLSVDLPLFDRNQGNIAIEKATRQTLFDEFINRVFEGRNDIAAAIAEIGLLHGQIVFAQSAVPVLERLVADYEKAVDAGNADVLSYYSARNDLDKKKIEVLKLKQDLVDAWISLENASGLCLTRPASSAAPASQPASQGVAP